MQLIRDFFAQPGADTVLLVLSISIGGGLIALVLFLIGLRVFVSLRRFYDEWIGP